MSDSQATNLASLIQIILALLGLFCLWRFVLRKAAWQQLREPAALAPWDVTAPDFLTNVLGAVCGAFVGVCVVSAIAGFLKLSTEAKVIFGTVGMQLGLLAVSAILPLGLRRDSKWTKELWFALRSGVITFLIALPLIYGAAAGWTALLKACGVAIEKQEVMDLLLNAKTSTLILVLIPMASIIAPMGEELFFRGIVFRFMRTHTPRWMALLLPAALFAASHLNLAASVPLVVLALVFALAYERTGRIGTTMVAHGLFNLHSIVLVLLGVGT